jgi:hypothetical protein
VVPVRLRLRVACHEYCPLDLPLGLENGNPLRNSRAIVRACNWPMAGAGGFCVAVSPFCLAFNFSAPRAFVRPWPATVHPDAHDAAPRAHCSVIQVEIEQPKSEPGPPQDPQRGH